MVNPLEQRRQKYVKRKKEYGDREEETLAKLSKFTNSLKEIKMKSVKSEEDDNKEDSKEVYYGQVLEKDDNEEVDLSNWHVGKLKFQKHIDDKYRANA